MSALRSIVRGATLALTSLLVGAAALPAPAAWADDEACAAAYERAQEQRRLGRLIRAREQLLVCSQPRCPGFVVDDCRRWFGEVDEALPTVAFAVRQGGRDLEAVRVYRDGVLLARRLDGRALPVDPGKHTFTIEVPGVERRTVEALIVEGKKNRLIELELPAAAPVAMAKARPAPSPPASNGSPLLSTRTTHARPRRAPSALTWGLAAGGAAGVAGFAGLGLWGLREERRMREECAPACAPSEVSAVRRSYLLADVSLGLGLGSLALATYFYLRGEGPSPVDGATGLRPGDGLRGLQFARRF